MRITEIRHLVVPISSAIRNAYIDFSKMNVSIVAIKTNVRRGGKPVTGYGFNSNGRYAQEGLLKERFIPRLLDTNSEELLKEDGKNFDPFKAWEIMMANEKPGGHGERSVAVGILDMALWDLVSKIEEKPLYQLLAQRYNRGHVKEKVYVYAAGGYYYPGKDLVQLQTEMQSYLDLGYNTVKIKIGGTSLSDDLYRIEAVLNLLGPGQELAVDANGRFELETAGIYADALNGYPLKWYEEAGDPLDFELNAAVCLRSKNPVATGENLFSMVDARNLIRYGGMRPEFDYLQFDPALSYGLVEYMRTLEMLENNGWSRNRCIPHGGHQFALHIAAGLGLGGNESYPHVFKPFGGFGDGLTVRDGKIALPQVPGIGMELKRDLWEILKEM